MGIDINKSILIDTNCFIYYFEDNPAYSEKLEKMFTDIQNGYYKAFMSVISFMEILVKPKKEQNTFMVNRYKLMLTNYPNLTIVNVDYKIAEIASRLRADYNIKTPDAIILASAITMSANSLITNDIKLKHICKKENIGVISIDELSL